MMLQAGFNGTAATVRDLFAHKALGTFKNSFTAPVNPSGVRMVRLDAAP